MFDLPYRLGRRGKPAAKLPSGSRWRNGSTITAATCSAGAQLATELQARTGWTENRGQDQGAGDDNQGRHGAPGESHARECGGRIYPVNSMVENVEFFLVAAIVIIGLRAYFVQPFKIPTNSMWPSYYGMKPEVYHQPEDVPGVASRVARFVLFGARHYEVTAPESGVITVLVAMGLNIGKVAGRSIMKTCWPSSGSSSRRPTASTRFISTRRR